MKLWVVVLVVVLAFGGAAVGTKISGDYVGKFLEQSDQIMEDEYGVESRTVIIDKTFLSSNAQTVVFVAPATEESKGVQVVSDYVIQHGPLSAHYKGDVDILVDGESLFLNQDTVEKPQITGKIGLRSNKSTVRLKSFEITDEEYGSFSLRDDIVMKTKAKNDMSQYKANLSMPSLEFTPKTDPDDTLVLREVKALVEQKGNWKHSDSSKTIADIVIGNMKAGNKGIANDLVLKYVVDINKDVLDFEFDTSASNYSVIDPNGASQQGSFAYAMTMTGLNLEAIKPLVMEYNEYMNKSLGKVVSGESMTEQSQAEMTAFMASMSEERIKKAAQEMFRSSDIKMKLKPSYFESNTTGRVDANGFLDIDTRDIYIADFMNAKEDPTVLLDYADNIKAALSIDGIPPSLALFAGGEESVEASIDNGSVSLNGEVLFNIQDYVQMMQMQKSMQME